MTSDRRPAGAVLLTLCVTGLGHLYAGRPRAALAFAVAGHLYGVALVFLILSRPSAPAFLCAVVIGLGLALTAIVHAGIVAKRAIRPYELRWYNRWWIYVLVLLFAWFVWQPGLKSLINRSVSAFRNPSPAMEPTILPGDHLFADVRPAARRMPERNDVVIFRSIDQPGLTVMKRVVGIPGDTLETRDGQLFRNGHRVAEPWIVPLSSSDATPLVRGKTPSVPSSTGQPTMLNWGPIVVPAGRLFVMGDNRPDSYEAAFGEPCRRRTSSAVHSRSISASIVQRGVFAGTASARRPGWCHARLRAATRLSVADSDVIGSPSDSWPRRGLQSRPRSPAAPVCLTADAACMLPQ